VKTSRGQDSVPVGDPCKFPVYGKVLVVRMIFVAIGPVGLESGDWPETGEICCVPKRTGVSWELGGSKGVECRGRVTAKGSHKRTNGLVATVGNFPGKITSGLESP